MLAMLLPARAHVCAHATLPRRYLPMPANDASTQVFSQVPTFDACVELCDYDPCAFVTYDYVTKSCSLRNVSDTGWTG